MAPNNEGKACDAVIRLLERKTGSNRSDMLRPERTGDGPPVEIRFNLGMQNYAFEHTRIEAFEGQIQTAEEFRSFIRPVVEELSGTLPGPAVYHLYFPTNARLDIKARQMDEIRRGFIAWVREHAQRLHQMNPERPTRDRNPHGVNERHRARPPGFRYEVTLEREAHWARSQRHDGILLPVRMAPEDVEALRACRLRRALQCRCPKLRRCQEDGARTVLVLEDGDIALSNHVLIGDALADLLPDQVYLPDEMYLVETALDTWVVRCLKRDELLMPDAQWAEFDSAELIDITGKAQK